MKSLGGVQPLPDPPAQQQQPLPAQSLVSGLRTLVTALSPPTYKELGMKLAEYRHRLHKYRAAAPANLHQLAKVEADPHALLAVRQPWFVRRLRSRPREEPSLPGSVPSKQEEQEEKAGEHMAVPVRGYHCHVYTLSANQARILDWLWPLAQPRVCVESRDWHLQCIKPRASWRFLTHPSGKYLVVYGVQPTHDTVTIRLTLHGGVQPCGTALIKVAVRRTVDQPRALHQQSTQEQGDAKMQADARGKERDHVAREALQVLLVDLPGAAVPGMAGIALVQRLDGQDAGDGPPPSMEWECFVTAGATTRGVPWSSKKDRRLAGRASQVSETMLVTLDA